MIFHRCLSNSQSPQVPWTLLSILTNLKNALVWMVLISPLIPNLLSPLSKPLGTILSTVITIDITVNLMFLSFFRSLTKYKYTLFSLSLILTLWLGGISKIHYMASSHFLLVIIIFDLLTGIGWSICTSKSNRFLCISFSRTDSGLCIYHLIECLNFNFLYNFKYITFPT